MKNLSIWFEVYCFKKLRTSCDIYVFIRLKKMARKLKHYGLWWARCFLVYEKKICSSNALCLVFHLFLFIYSTTNDKKCTNLSTLYEMRSLMTNLWIYINSNKLIIYWSNFTFSFQNGSNNWSHLKFSFQNCFLVQPYDEFASFSWHSKQKKS